MSVFDCITVNTQHPFITADDTIVQLIQLEIEKNTKNQYFIMEY